MFVFLFFFFCSCNLSSLSLVLMFNLFPEYNDIYLYTCCYPLNFLTYIECNISTYVTPRHACTRGLSQWFNLLTEHVLHIAICQSRNIGGNFFRS